MDLSFSRFEADVTVTALPPDLAVLMVGVAARQAASPTAMRQARLPEATAHCDRFVPAHGAFNLTVAALIVSSGGPVPFADSFDDWEDEK